MPRDKTSADEAHLYGEGDGYRARKNVGRKSIKGSMSINACIFLRTVFRTHIYILSYIFNNVRTLLLRGKGLVLI